VVAQECKGSFDFAALRMTGLLTEDAGVGGGDPDALGGGAAKGDIAGGGGEGEGLVVVAFEEAEFCRGTNTAGFEEFQEAAVTFVDSADEIGGPGGGVGQEQEAAMAAAGGALHLAEITVRTGAGLAELGEEFGFEVRRDSVLEALGLVVDLPPLHSEKLGQHAFDEMVAEGEFTGDLAAGSGEAHVSVGLNADEAVFFQAADGHSNGGRGDCEPVGEAGGDDGFAFTLGFEDGLEIVLFGDGDHLGRLYDGGLIMVNSHAEIFNTEGTGEDKAKISMETGPQVETPCGGVGDIDVQGVLRLRFCFAIREAKSSLRMTSCWGAGCDSLTGWLLSPNLDFLWI
jgi:hypothetical protein